MFLAVQYLSFVQGYGTLRGAAALAPIGALVVPAALAADPLARRYGRARVSATGLAVMVIGFLVLVPLEPGSGYPQVGVAFTIISAGFGLAAAPATDGRSRQGAAQGPGRPWPEMSSRPCHLRSFGFRLCV